MRLALFPLKVVPRKFFSALPLLLAAVFSLSSCEAETQEEAAVPMVVEGWIDDGGFPRVLLSTCVPISSGESREMELSDYVLRWARVEVSDDEGNTVVLTGKPMSGYQPPYGYTTSDLRGRSGHTYRLKVDCGSYHAEAVTTIPAPVSVKSVEAVPCAACDTLYEVRATLSAPLGEGAAGVKMFVCYADGSDRQWHPSRLSLYPAASVTASTVLPVCPPYEAGTADTPYFRRNRMPLVRVAAVDSASYAFWESYEESASLSRNPFFTVTRNLRGNVDGALGYWCGYAAAAFLASPPEE